MTQQRYWTDLTDEQWRRIECHLPPEAPRGRKWKYPRRGYFQRDFVSGSGRLFLAVAAPGLPALSERLRLVCPLETGRQVSAAPGSPAHPGAGRLGAGAGAFRGHCGQPNRANDGRRGPPGSIGADVYKAVSAGRKRHVLVDTLGYVLAVVVQSAALPDRTGARQALAQAGARWTRRQWIWADGGYEGAVRRWAWQVWGWWIGLVKRTTGVPGWQLLPHRWVVERTFAWLGRFRRLSKDYEFLPETSEALIRVAMIHLLVRRLTRIRAS